MLRMRSQLPIHQCQFEAESLIGLVHAAAVRFHADSCHRDMQHKKSLCTVTPAVPRKCKTITAAHQGAMSDVKSQAQALNTHKRQGYILKNTSAMRQQATKGTWPCLTPLWGKKDIANQSLLRNGVHARS